MPRIAGVPSGDNGVWEVRTPQHVFGPTGQLGGQVRGQGTAVEGRDVRRFFRKALNTGSATPTLSLVSAG